MERIHAVTFAPFCARGTFEKEETRQSLKLMKEKTGANYVIFAPNGVQKTAFSENIDYRTKRNVSDEELTAMIAYAKQLGLKVALKPTANCEDGTWRAHINFFDEDVVCEPKWSNWFASYRAFQEHYAGLAQQCGVDLFIAGCEMVQTERREAEWREVIAAIRRKYDGLVSYSSYKARKLWDVISFSIPVQTSSATDFNIFSAICCAEAAAGLQYTGDTASLKYQNSLHAIE